MPENTSDSINHRYVLAEFPLGAVSAFGDNFRVTLTGNRFELRQLTDRVQIVCHETEPDADLLEQILEMLDIDSDWFTWINPELKLTPHEIWRQDDNGNSFVVRLARCRADAVRMIRRLETFPHKQTYWMRPQLIK